MTVSHSGYLKRTPVSTYRSQRRGGSGRRGMATREDDFVEKLFIASTHDYMLIFTNTGRVYWLKVYEIPDVGAGGQGQAHGQSGGVAAGRKRARPAAGARSGGRGHLRLLRHPPGHGEEDPVQDFSNVMSRGIIAIGIEKDDELVAAALTDGSEIVFLATHEGMAMRFDENDVRPMGRPAYGVRGMDLGKGDYIVGMAITPKEAPHRTRPTARPNGKVARSRHTAKNGKKIVGRFDSHGDRERLWQTYPD